MLKYFSRWLLSIWLLHLFIVVAWADGGTNESHELAKLQAVTGPKVVARRFIPSDRQRQGELRLMIDGADRRVQVLPYTTSLGRALREMRKSERLNWPSGKAWQSHSLKYLKSLDEFRAHLRAEKDSETSKGPVRYDVMIELISGEGDSMIRLAEVEYNGTPAAMIRLVPSKSKFQVGLGNPSIQAITAIGRGAEIFSTKSHSPDSFCIRLSTISLPMSSISAWNRCRALGVNFLAMSLR